MKTETSLLHLKRFMLLTREETLCSLKHTSNSIASYRSHIKCKLIYFRSLLLCLSSLMTFLQKRIDRNFPFSLAFII